MRSKLLVVSVLVLLVHHTMAQNPVEMGVRAGTNITQGYGQAVYGIFRELELIKYIKFHTELNYSQHVALGQPDATYLTLPVLLKYQAWHGVTVQTGLQLGVNAAKSNVRAASDRELLEFAGIAGIGYDFHFPLKINFRFVKGIGNIDKGDSSGQHVKSSKYTQISLEYGLFRRE